MIKKFESFANNEPQSISGDEIHIKDLYQNNKVLKINNKVDDFIKNNGVPSTEEDMKEYLVKYSNDILKEFPVDNMIDLIYSLNHSRTLILDLLKSIVKEYKKDNNTRSRLSPLFRSTLIKINEIEKILNMLVNKSKI